MIVIGNFEQVLHTNLLVDKEPFKVNNKDTRVLIRLHYLHYFSLFPENIHLFKVTIETLEKDVKYIQN